MSKKVFIFMLAKHISAFLRGFSREQAFFCLIWVKIYVPVRPYGLNFCCLILFYCFLIFSSCYSLLILLFLSLLILLVLYSSPSYIFLSSYIKLFVVLQTCILATHWAEVHKKAAKLMLLRENPAKIPVWQKIRQSIPLLI